MTKKTIAFALAGILTAAAALLYKCEDESPVVGGKDGVAGTGGSAGAAAGGSAGKIDAGIGGTR